MRTRTETIPLDIPSGNINVKRHDHLPAPPTLANPVLEDVNYPTDPYFSTTSPDSSTKTITDELPKHKYPGYCLHDVQETRVANLATPVDGAKLAGSPLTWWEWQISGGALWSLYLKPRMATLYPSVTFQVADWSLLSYEAMQEMQPRFSQLSLINDLIEIRQIKDLLKPQGKAKSIIGRVSNDLLWQEFGVKPTIDSIIGVIGLMRTLRSKIIDLRNRAKRLQTRHYARRMDINSNLPADGVIFTENPGEFRQVRLSRVCRWKMLPKYHATVQFRYDISSLTDTELEIRAWLEATGVLNPTRTLWNAIPYSFVVDWFSTIGDWVDSLTSQPAIPIVIESFVHSIKYSYQTNVDVDFWQGAFSMPLAYGLRTYYERRRDIPASTAPILFKEPSAAAYALGSALIGQASESSKWKKRRLVKLPKLFW